MFFHGGVKKMAEEKDVKTVLNQFKNTSILLCLALFFEFCTNFVAAKGTQNIFHAVGMIMLVVSMISYIQIKIPEESK